MKETSFTFDNPHRSSTAFIPKSVVLLAKLALLSFKPAYNNREDVDFLKLNGLLDSFKLFQPENKLTGQKPSLALCPDIRSKPWWHSEDDPLIANIKSCLRQNHQAITEEYESVCRRESVTSDYAPAKRYPGFDASKWKAYTISTIAGIREDARNRFPHTASVIESLGVRIIQSEFLAMEAGVNLPVHTDGTNLVLACQMCLNGPDECALNVAREKHDITPGEVVVFDQSYPHTAWNKGKTARTVLILTILHPDISETEFELGKKVVKRTQLLSLLLSPVILLEFLAHKLSRRFRESTSAD